MKQKIIQIPTLTNESPSFQHLFKIWSEVRHGEVNVRFKFSKCKFLSSQAIAFLGGLIRLVESHNGKAVIDWDSFPEGSTVKSYLKQNGFAMVFGDFPLSSDLDSVPYREHREEDAVEIMEYLVTQWIGRGWVHVSQQLRDDIASRMWEIYTNAFEHSGTTIGVFACGHHFTSSRELIFTVVDFGCGIPFRVHNFFSRKGIDNDVLSGISDAAFLEWAFTRGNSAADGVIARGLGLDLLKEFVRLNNGKLEVYSNGGYARFDKDGEKFEEHGFVFGGTVLHITLRCDDEVYFFRKGESPPLQPALENQP